MNKRLNFVIGSTLILLLFVAVGLTQAQGPKPGETGPLGGESAAAIAPGAIPVQGRLTDSGGNPLNGDYNLTFRLYDVATGGTALCSDVNSVSVQNGLFNSYIDNCNDDVWGQKLWFAVQVGSDPEMTPRQVIYPVPYALSLRPGAVISGTGYPILEVVSTNSSGRALRAYALATSGTNYGVVGASKSPNGYGGYFYNNDDGTGVYGKGTPGVLGEASGFGHGIVGRAGVFGAGVKGEGNALGFGGLFTNTMGGVALVAESDGTALQLGGSGRIESTAKSYVWISGNGARPYHQGDSTIIDMDTIGGAKISRGATAGNKNIMLPIAITGMLYGQNVRISDLDIYWVSDTTFDGIGAVLLRRQAGVCPTCYVNILNDHPSPAISCEDSVNPSGCTRHYHLTTNNTLTSNSGILYLTIELVLEGSGAASWVEIGGIRLTLEHN